MQEIILNSYGLRAAAIVDVAFAGFSKQFTNHLDFSTIESELSYLNDRCVTKQNLYLSDVFRDARWLRFIDFTSTGQGTFTYFDRFKDTKLTGLKIYNKIMSLFNSDLKLYIAVNSINNFLKLHNAKPINHDDIEIVAEVEKNKEKAIAKYGFERILKIAGEPLNPFKSEQMNAIKTTIEENKKSRHIYQMSELEIVEYAKSLIDLTKQEYEIVDTTSDSEKNYMNYLKK